ncbi:hypothetical protein BATDEDRAFT_21389 [Batrachochytrium dendrobatidis JAM81]|uniref:Uncharacterized protein n=1 Tax=Batrachochytrium dendrobatidis (strain JAM81 / FGSC 10211) TaxID=684364 RepID=F4NSU4_BATDJ|nr:uncharacterized protein BATDEDRAFT_21389 [Batrachochytrium dendrobatidis JAM81]EGF83054.1 hypothetical protein BATDEDRAFT_21389 [Batrachochytrium dendrobatidis JAM81]|eukprot:XP_006675275.1 hypothetical protein BATDEDRAFT_21389 [Batrachochytrium dendrobatidis JAM81]
MDESEDRTMYGYAKRGKKQAQKKENFSSKLFDFEHYNNGKKTSSRTSTVEYQSFHGAEPVSRSMITTAETISPNSSKRVRREESVVSHERPPTYTLTDIIQRVDQKVDV